MRTAISNAPNSIFFLVASCILAVVSGFQFSGNHITGSSGAITCLVLAIIAGVCAGVDIRDSYQKCRDLQGKSDCPK